MAWLKLFGLFVVLLAVTITFITPKNDWIGERFDASARNDENVNQCINYLNTSNELNNRLFEWHKHGQYLNIMNHNIFTIFEKCKKDDPRNIVKQPNWDCTKHTFLLIHGFPSSSYDYHKIFDTLLHYGNILTFDHIGFGFSDKPKENFTYSIAEHCDILIHILMHFQNENKNGYHIISHDMGDSILTEFITRYKRKLLPISSMINENTPNTPLIKSITFTNGGMQVNMINFRLTQRISMSPFGKYLSVIQQRLPPSILYRVSKQQLKSVWGTSMQKQENKEMNQDIDDLITLNHCQDGINIMYKLIYYLHDRFNFEYKWIDSLKNIDKRKDKFPFLILWSDDDAVSPLAIGKTIYQLIGTNNNNNSNSNNAFDNKKMIVVGNAGHFLMLEQPNVWVNHIVEFIVSINK